jgi:hypothetical protein
MNIIAAIKSDRIPGLGQGDEEMKKKTPKKTGSNPRLAGAAKWKKKNLSNP